MCAYRIGRPLSDKIDRLENCACKIWSDLPDDLITALNNLGLLVPTHSSNASTQPIPAREPIKHISLNVAQSCNLNCVYCYGMDGEYNQKGFIDKEVAFRAVDWLIQQSMNEKVILITFFGGEPLLNFPLIKQVVTYAKEQTQGCGKKVFFSITTNGTLLTKEIDAYLNEQGFSVVISFDGTLQMQNLNRPFKNKNGSHENTQSRVQEFVATRDGKVTARATITSYNANLKMVRDSLREIGFKRSLCAEASPNIFNNKINGSCCSYSLREDQKKELLNDIMNQAEETFIAIKQRERPFSGIIFGILHRLNTKLKRKYYCGVGRGLVGVSIDGTVYPCHRFVGSSGFEMGTVNDFNSDSRSAYINNYGVSTKHCSTCWTRYFCGGGCLYEALMTNGTMDKPYSNSCDQIRRFVEKGIVVYDKLDKSDRDFLSTFGRQEERTS